MRVLYQDEGVLVIDKPAGISVHQREGDNTERTIAEVIKDKVGDDSSERPGIVHRLDKDTSGVMVIAKNSKTKTFLQKQFKDRHVKKTYLALVHGHPEHDEAVLDWPIGRNPKNPLKQSVVGRGREAVTRYKVIKKFKNYSLLEVYPQTGRTHQIRVHLAHLGHPIAGDAVYGRSEPKLERQFLHAYKLKLVLPNGKSREFTSELPPDLMSFLSAM